LNANQYLEFFKAKEFREYMIAYTLFFI